MLPIEKMNPHTYSESNESGVKDDTAANSRRDNGLYKIGVGIKTETGELKKAVKKQMMGSLLAAFGLVVGLAWNEAIKSFIEYWLPLGGNGLSAKFIYAALLTVFLAVFTYYLVGSAEKNDENKN